MTQELLEKHNPILVAFPQEPATRTRPGSLRPGPAGWGDYHPCSVEFFLANAHLRDRSPGYRFGLLPPRWKALPRTGIPAIAQCVREASHPSATRDWELDVAEIPSQKEREAWRLYRQLLAGEAAHPYERVVYGRWLPEGLDGPTRVLQYWYLYLYNDFRNNHEGDWEMVTIELDKEGVPARVGLSSHHGGSQRPWDQVEKDGDRPIVHVALGSHANYFEYSKDGHDVLDLEFFSGLPAPLELAISLIKRLPWIRRMRDWPPADPKNSQPVKGEHIGDRFFPRLRTFPVEVSSSPDGDWWWFRYWGRWGSSRPRVFGTVGVSTPWRPASEAQFQDWRWEDPLRWLDGCRQR